MSDLRGQILFRKVLEFADFFCGIRHVGRFIASAAHGDGRHIRGIGFGQFPCEVDLEKLDATYYNVDPQLVSMIAEMDDRIFRISQAVIRYAQRISGKPIPGNFAFSLTDHIQFAIERQRKNIQVKILADKQTVEDLDYCCERLGKTKSDVIRLGIQKVKADVDK